MKGGTPAALYSCRVPYKGGSGFFINLSKVNRNQNFAKNRYKLLSILLSMELTDLSSSEIGG